MMNHRKQIKELAKKQNISIKIKKGKWKKSWRIVLKNGFSDDFTILYNYLVLKGYYAKNIDMQKTNEFTIAEIDPTQLVEAEVWFFDNTKVNFKLAGKVKINPIDISNECERVFGTLQNTNYSHPFRNRSMDVGDFIKLPDGMCYIVDSSGWIKSRAITLEHFNQKYYPTTTWIRVFFAKHLYKTKSIAYDILEDAIAKEITDFTIAPAKNFMPTIEEFWQYWVNQNHTWW